MDQTRFFKHIPQVLDWIEILNNFFSVAGCIILLKEVTAIREYY